MNTLESQVHKKKNMQLDMVGGVSILIELDVVMVSRELQHAKFMSTKYVLCTVNPPAKLWVNERLKHHNCMSHVH